MIAFVVSNSFLIDEAISFMVSKNGLRSVISSGIRASTFRKVIALKYSLNTVQEIRGA